MGLCGYRPGVAFAVHARAPRVKVRVKTDWDAHVHALANADLKAKADIDPKVHVHAGAGAAARANAKANVLRQGAERPRDAAERERADQGAEDLDPQAELQGVGVGPRERRARRSGRTKDDARR